MPETDLKKPVDAIVVGAGFAGLYMLHRLRQLGLHAVVMEAGSDVGGTWYWNRYPGARCDAESLLYSFSFSPEIEQEWNWTERYATGAEILRYINFVADRLDLRRDIQLETRVLSMDYSDADNLWTVKTDKGQILSARFCILATGCLSVGRLPDIPGRDAFSGEQYHTGAWPHEGVDFSGKRVAVIGTGSSGIQAIPEIAKQAAHVTVFQRTPTFSVPAQNRPLSAEEITNFHQNTKDLRHRSRWGKIGGGGDLILTDEERVLGARSALSVSEEERRAAYESRWQGGGAYLISTFRDIMVDEAANETAADFVRAKIREIVKDPSVAEILTPTGYPIGSKRICVDTNYFATFNRENVTLVDLQKTPIETITGTGIRTSAQEYPFDMIVYATGFDAMTGALLKVDIHGRNGLSLRERWVAGPYTYLGIAVAGFPNLFTITGPGSPAVLSNVVVSIEQHVEWIADCLSYMRQKNLDRIEADSNAENEWTAHVTQVASGTLFIKGNSWYLGANIPGKPRVFMPYAGGVGVYRKTAEEVAAEDYRGFHLDKAAASAAAYSI